MKSPAKSFCRLCSGEIRLVIDFGEMPLANAFLSRAQFDSEYFFNLAAGFCEPCALFQLMEQPKPELMFHNTYPFFSGSSEWMRKHFFDLAARVKKDFIPNGGFVVELGSNDGTFLKNFPEEKFRRLGIEPSSNVAAEAKTHGIESETSFFDLQVAQKIKSENGSADLFIGTNVLCHIPDLAGTLQGVRHLLAPEGIAIFEDPYLGAVLEKTSYDQIYDEHVYLFSVTSLVCAFAAQGLRIFDVEPLWTHGGSLRYFACHPLFGRPNNSRVGEWLEREKQAGLGAFPRYQKFKEQCERSRDLLIDALSTLKAQGHRVTGYGATSKSTTVLNYCGITPHEVEFISDTTPEKQGKFSPGAHIPILPYESFRKNYPSHTLLFAWNHAQEIMPKEIEFKKSGGKWITYVPEVSIS